MKKLPLLICLTLPLIWLQAQQVTITPNGITPTMTYPRLTYDAMMALPSPVEGDLVYDLTFKCLRVYNGSKWVCTLTSSPIDPTPHIAAIATAGGSGYDTGTGVAVDASGNVYVTGSYRGTATFGNTTSASAGSDDIFVAKYNSSGSLQWVQSAGGANGDYGRSIAVDAAGNVYVSGAYSGTATFGSVSITSAGNIDIFVAKYNSSGSVQWVQSAGGLSVDQGSGIAVDASGNVYVTGYFVGTATFGSATKTSAGSADIFAAKYNSSGSLQWVQSAGGLSADFGNGIAVDALGNVYVTGYYAGTAAFGSTNLVTAGGNDMFAAKYSSSGSLQWVQSAGGTGADFGNGIAVDASGNVYVTGSYWGTATFGITTRTSAGSDDVFVAMYNSSGSLQWVQSAGGTSGDYGNGIRVAASGHVYVSGSYSDTATFESTSKTSAGISDIFAVKYNSSGSVQWVQSAGGLSVDYGNGIAVDASGHVYVTGNYVGTAAFGSVSKTSAGSNDVYLVRLSP
jgi:Beta-propeller repeat